MYKIDNMLLESSKMKLINFYLQRTEIYIKKRQCLTDKNNIIKFIFTGLFEFQIIFIGSICPCKIRCHGYLHHNISHCRLNGHAFLSVIYIFYTFVGSN